MRHCSQPANNSKMPTPNEKQFADVYGVVEPKVGFEDKTGLCITSSLSRTDSEGNLY